jgi:hypothetical protein
MTVSSNLATIHPVLSVMYRDSGSSPLVHARKGLKTVPGIGFFKIKVTVDFYCVLACRPTPKGGWTLDKEQIDFLSYYGLYPLSS